MADPHTFVQACHAFHDHHMTATQLWNWVSAQGYRGVWQAPLHGGLWDQIVNWCGGA